MNSNIDFLIVGAGLYGATIGRILTDCGYKCLIIEKRNHIAGNCYDELHSSNLYFVHKYGPHIFHTSNSFVAKFILGYTKFNSYQHNIIANYDDKIYNLPFNNHTFYDIFGLSNNEQIYNQIKKERQLAENKYKDNNNLEATACKLVGETIFKKLIKEYTEKQWNKKCDELSGDIIKRLPLRFNFNNNYYNDLFSGVPHDGYTNTIQRIINGECDDGKLHNPINYILNTNVLDNLDYWKNIPNYNIIYCGPIDELLNYELGMLEWRSLRFEEKSYQYNGHNGQGIHTVNYINRSVPYTRVVEHMYCYRENWELHNKRDFESVQTYEYPNDFEKGKDPYYPINNEKNNALYNDYLKLLSTRYPNIILGGRLGKYKYFDMDDTILEALTDANKLVSYYKNDDND